MPSVQPALAVMFLFATTVAAQTHLPATGLCNTGLTPAFPLPDGCRATTLVTPINPESGGSSVDGNWKLATPYPSAPYNAPAPDPCTLAAFGPAWVDAPWPSWFNPSDGLSQWITPQIEGPVAAGGWYVYATTLPIPPNGDGVDKYLLTVTGQLLVDDNAVAIFLENPAGHGCRALSTTELSGASAWSSFSLATTVLPATHAYLYFVAYNIEQDFGNPTGLRVEFTSAYFTPE
jgi:hypothetical protein